MPQAPKNVPTWTITIADAAVGEDASGLLPRALRCEIGMDGVGRCAIDLIVPEGASLPEPGALLVVALGFDGSNKPAFSGEIDGVRATVSGVTVTAGDALARLANAFGAGNFIDRTAGAIVRDVLGIGGAEAGTLDDGPTLGQYVLYPGLSLLHHLRVLAEQVGAVVFADADGKVHFILATAGKSHSFSLRGDVLAVDLRRTPTARSGVEVWGEGAGGSRGASKSHWLPTDLAGIKASAGTNGSAIYHSSVDACTVLVRDGAVRTGDAATEVAKGRAAALERPLWGSLEVAGAPTVAPNDLVSLTDFSLGHLEALVGAAALRVRRVRHRLDLERGFTTRMEF